MSLSVKPSHSEADYMAREEVNKKKRLAEEIKAQYESIEREKLKNIHWMHCPKCGMELQSLLYKGVMIDKCFSCGGVFLDTGALEQISGEEEGIISSIVSLFK